PLMLLRRRQSHFGIGKGDDRNPCSLEGKTQGVTNRRVVIDDREHGRLAAHLIQSGVNIRHKPRAGVDFAQALKVAQAGGPSAPIPRDYWRSFWSSHWRDRF